MGHEGEHFFTVQGVDKKGIYAYLGAELGFGRNALIHLEVLRWGPSIYRMFYKDWEDFKEILKKEFNVNRLVATRVGTVSDYKTWIKFVSKFGFNELREQVTLMQEI
jgi:hypothetical protein